MPKKFANQLRGLIRHFGFDVIRHVEKEQAPPPVDFDELAVRTIQLARPYTMTSLERLFAVIQAVRYVSAANIPGDIVECGVWRGGSMLAAARTLMDCADTERSLFLFDTFEGMTHPTDVDVAMDGQLASNVMRQGYQNDPEFAWCAATLEDVKSTMAKAAYNPRLVHYIKGKVEDTIPANIPASIALLRLDTDWYESTRHELEHLFPRLSRGGVLIIDDYGHWQGARKAVDEYISGNNLKLLLNRIDYTGRIAVKIE